MVSYAQTNVLSFIIVYPIVSQQTTSEHAFHKLSNSLTGTPGEPIFSKKLMLI